MLPMKTKLSSTFTQRNKILIEVKYAINNTIYHSTKETSTKLQYGVKQRFKYDVEIKKYLDSINSFDEKDLKKVM